MNREELARAMWEAAEKAPGQGSWNNPYKWDDPTMSNVRNRYLAAADVAIGTLGRTSGDAFTDETFWRDVVDEHGEPTGEQVLVRQIVVERVVVAGVSLEITPDMDAEVLDAVRQTAVALLDERVARMDGVAP